MNGRTRIFCETLLVLAAGVAVADMLSGCGTTPPSPSPDAAGIPLCADIRPSCADPVSISRICAETGMCYCDVGTKGMPDPIRCSL